MAKRKNQTETFVFTKSATTEIRCELSEFKGKLMLNMREWWGDSDDDAEDYKPGKGFTVPIGKAAEFLEQLAEWAANVEVPEAPAGEIKKKSRVTTKDGDEGVVVRIKGEFAFVVLDGDDDDEETRIKLSKLELVAPKKSKKSSKSKKSTDVDEELADLEDDDTPKKKSKKAKGKKKARSL